jgi:AcrR family transcriptional regulator
MSTVSELGDRRARKKAQTRAEIRQAAQELFAEHGFDTVTIADIAATADVAVQTVFNHFPTKEELFFDGRTPWVDEPAETVRSRCPQEPPLAALREWTAGWITQAAGRDADDERRSYVATLAASPSLRTFELSLLQRAEERLAAALIEAWSSDPSGAPQLCGGELGVRMAAGLTAAIWVAGARTLRVELRAVEEDGADARAVRRTVVTLADKLFDRLERSLGALFKVPGAELTDPALNLPGPSRAAHPARRAG